MKDDEPKKRNRFHTALVIVLFIFFLIFLTFEGIIYYPFAPRGLSAYHPAQSEGEKFYLLEFGDVDKGSIEYITDFLSKETGKQVESLGRVPIPGVARGRPGQLDADFLLFIQNSELSKHKDLFRLIGITSEDIYSKDFAFIFGQTDVENKSIIISDFMLVPRDDNGVLISNPDANLLNLYHKRLRKLLRHEIGHSYYLHHCWNPNCVMAFPESLAELDAQSEFFYPVCLYNLSKNQRK